MAGKRREEAKRTQAIEDAAAMQSEILKELSNISKRLTAIEKLLTTQEKAPKGSTK